jgi:predicted N-acetyltransferase YhbS
LIASKQQGKSNDSAGTLEAEPTFMTSPVITRASQLSDVPAISALHERVFGPGRFARSAYRVREMAGLSRLMSPFCRVALCAERVIASVTFAEITIGEGAGALLLGPLAVDPEFAGQGYGRRLVSEGLEAARSAGRTAVLLVGDMPYYERFGFEPVPPGQITLPGPVNPARLLGLNLADGALATYRGAVSAAL